MAASSPIPRRPGVAGLRPSGVPRAVSRWEEPAAWSEPSGLTDLRLLLGGPPAAAPPAPRSSRIDFEALVAAQPEPLAAAQPEPLTGAQAGTPADLGSTVSTWNHHGTLQRSPVEDLAAPASQRSPAVPRGNTHPPPLPGADAAPPQERSTLRPIAASSPPRAEEHLPPTPSGALVLVGLVGVLFAFQIVRGNSMAGRPEASAAGTEPPAAAQLEPAGTPEQGSVMAPGAAPVRAEAPPPAAPVGRDATRQADARSKERVKARATERATEQATERKEEPAPAPPAAAPFDRAAALGALAPRASQAAACGAPGGEAGTARVSVTFAPSGRATQARVEGAFAGTGVGSCIAGQFRGLHIPPFEGPAVTVVKRVEVR
jgi:hypothetical protein